VLRKEWGSFEKQHFKLTDNPNEKSMLAYWLGNLSEDESDKLIIRWLQHKKDSELLSFVKSELIENYLSNNLDDSELISFNKFFLPNHYEEVAIAKFYFDLR
jgi:hypothetical protein